MSGGSSRLGDGATQHWDPDRYARNARFVADLGLPVLELLAPRQGERILDLGCGDGPLTEKIAALGIQVVGVDASVEQIAARCGQGLPRLLARLGELELTQRVRRLPGPLFVRS